MSLVGRPGLIDLGFASPLLPPYLSQWADPLPSTGFDHIAILLLFDAPFGRPPPPTPNWALTDWVPVDAALKSLPIPPPPTDLCMAWDVV